MNLIMSIRELFVNKYESVLLYNTFDLLIINENTFEYRSFY